MRGLTLIETLVTIAVFSLVMGAMVSFIIMTYRAQTYTWHQSIAVDEARKGIETMVKELREAREGDDGSYPIEKAEDKEIIFYSDIDQDKQTERVRYFLGTVGSGSQTQKCVTLFQGGACSVTFSNFFTGTLTSAQVKVSVEGDLGASNEYTEIFADSQKLGNLCQTGCSDCAGIWQGTATFDVLNQASDNSITFLADATSKVDPSCNWEETGHAMKANFEFSWTEEIAGTGLKRGVIEPTSPPVEYLLDQEKVTVLSSYVRNTPPIFEYFDKDGNKITDYPARLVDTKLIKVFLVIDVEEKVNPSSYELESSVRLRNLRNE